MVSASEDGSGLLLPPLLTFSLLLSLMGSLPLSSTFCLSLREESLRHMRGGYPAKPPPLMFVRLSGNRIKKKQLSVFSECPKEGDRVGEPAAALSCVSWGRFLTSWLNGVHQAVHLHVPMLDVGAGLPQLPLGCLQRDRGEVGPAPLAGVSLPQAWAGGSLEDGGSTPSFGSSVPPARSPPCSMCSQV